MKKKEIEKLLLNRPPLGYKWNHKMDSPGPLREGEYIRISSKEDAERWSSEYNPKSVSIEPVYTLSEILRALENEAE